MPETPIIRSPPSSAVDSIVSPSENLVLACSPSPQQLNTPSHHFTDCANLMTSLRSTAASTTSTVMSVWTQRPPLRPCLLTFIPATSLSSSSSTFLSHAHGLGTPQSRMVTCSQRMPRATATSPVPKKARRPTGGGGGGGGGGSTRDAVVSNSAGSTCHRTSDPVVHSDGGGAVGGIRINKCFKSFASRRESDAFVDERRVTVNGAVAEPGVRVWRGDEVRLDGRVIDWERLTIGGRDNVDGNGEREGNEQMATRQFVYVKHWKAEGTVCTTDMRVPDNIIGEVTSNREDDFGDRIFPVGRLDQSSTGLILLTSDGRLPNAVLGAANSSCVKTYVVTPDMYVSDEHIWYLQKGIVIKTVAQRDRNVRKPLVAKTLPCKVQRVPDSTRLLITLTEGRNRQIRKMLGALGYTTRTIHRTCFMGITLDGLCGPGDTCFLNDDEMEVVRSKLKA